MASEQRDDAASSSMASNERLTPQQKALHNYVFRSMKRARDIFINDYENFPEISDKAYVYICL